MRQSRCAPVLGAFIAAEFLAVAGAATWSQDALADAESDARNASSEVQAVARELPNIQGVVARAATDRPSPERRLATGEMLFRTKDYGRAIVVLSAIIEEFPDTASYPDALWLRAETYYAAEQYLAARRDYKALADHPREARFESYAARALARLVDVSLRLNEKPEALQEIFDRLGQVPPAQVDAGIHYARGKALLHRDLLDEAKQAFAAVAVGSQYVHQARYFEGLIALKKAQAAAIAAPSGNGAAKTPPNYKAAVAAFQQVVEQPPDTPEHKHVIDLAWLAIGRLFYESEQYDQAAEAYQKVERDSPEFDTMLYELGWVYVREGDVERAERALEVLAISDPASPFIAKGTLLRADLLLRSGGYPEALKLYKGVREEYDGVLGRVAAFLDPSMKDVAVYYKKLVDQQADLFDQSSALPSVALRWAREEEDGPLAFSLIEDVNQCRSLIRQSSQIVEKLSVIVGAANRVQAFPDLAAGVQTAMGLQNRLSRGRLWLARALDKDEPGDVSGELASVRTERRGLMETIEKLPIAEGDFSKREEDGSAQWNKVSQELTRRGLEIDGLQASLNALRHMLKSEPENGVTRDPAAIHRFSEDLDNEEREFRRFREQAEVLRHMVENGRAQIGLGDARFQHDKVARDRFRALLEREVQLAATGQAGADGQRAAARLLPVVDQAARYDDQVEVAMKALRGRVDDKSGDLKQQLDAERLNIESYRAKLEALDGVAKEVVGNVAKRNFNVVKDRLKDIVLKADVGITEHAWEVRSEENERVGNLLSERSRQAQLLDEELKEVRDDGVEPAPQGGANP